MKYTEYKLSERQLKVLSQIVNRRQRNFFSPTLAVLQRHELIAEWHGDHHATKLGIDTLAEARAAGW